MSGLCSLSSWTASWQLGATSGPGWDPGYSRSRVLQVPTNMDHKKYRDLTATSNQVDVRFIVLRASIGTYYDIHPRHRSTKTSVELPNGPVSNPGNDYPSMMEGCDRCEGVMHATMTTMENAPRPETGRPSLPLQGLEKTGFE